MTPHLVDPVNIMFGKLALAVLLGLLVGTERAIAGKQAGSRTFAFVSLGSCLFVLISNYVNLMYLGVVDFQPTLMASAIITGVGFIGAGLIVIHGDAPRGVTTAAGLWVAAAVGTAVGFGMYAVAIFTSFLALVIFTALWFVENSFRHWFVGWGEKEHANGASTETRP